MSIVVNTNVSSLNAQRNLAKVGKSLDTAMERLASGLRINHAGDDAAGLAIATGIDSQVKGLNQAVRNANDGLSVVGTAEGALNTQVDILQRIRELSVQAANDINSANNRASIQEEIDAQVSELTRLGNTTEFNGQNLMNGLFQNKQLQVGAYANQTISMSLGDFRATGMGQIATTTGGVVNTTALSGAGTGFTLNGTAIGATASDGVSTVFATASALAKANAINASSSQTGVTATAGSAVYTAGAAVPGAGSVGGAANTLTLNGVSVLGTAFTTAANDSDGQIVNRINQKSNQTGVVASYTGAGAATRIVLTAADGRNIQAVAAGTVAAQTGIATANTYGTVSLSSNSDIVIGGTQVADVGFAAGTVVVDPNSTVSKVDVTTQAGATTGIQIIDAALKKVADAQAQLGALSNRLTNTINNIQVSVENLSASVSRIRDADFAVETANMTRAQIIQQSSIAVLTQANTRPQSALTLLGQ